MEGYQQKESIAISSPLLTTISEVAQSKDIDGTMKHLLKNFEEKKSSEIPLVNKSQDSSGSFNHSNK
jgi:hypothetical protein